MDIRKPKTGKDARRNPGVLYLIEYGKNRIQLR